MRPRLRVMKNTLKNSWEKRLVGKVEGAYTPFFESAPQVTEKMGSQNLRINDAPSHDDALLHVKEYAWVGFNQLKAGTPQDFEHLWGEAFGEFLSIATAENCLLAKDNKPYFV